MTQRQTSCSLPVFFTHLGLLPKLLSVDFLHLHLCVGLLVHRALHQQKKKRCDDASVCVTEFQLFTTLRTTSALSSSRVLRRLRTGLATTAVPLVSRCPMADGSMSSRLLALTVTSTP